MGYTINSQQYYLMLSGERKRLLRKLEHIIAQIMINGGDTDRMPQLVKVARRAQMSAAYYEVLAQI